MTRRPPARPPSPLALLVGGLAILAGLYALAVLPALLFLALTNR